jgi:hypothetical protein
MPARYQLACPNCSTVHTVSPAQAGETLACDCGHPLAVPTLRELRTREPVVAEGDARRSADWNLWQGLLFVGGAILIVIGALTTWRILPQRQALDLQRPEFREIDFNVQMLSLPQAWQAWEHFREQKLEFRTTPEYLENRERYRELSGYLYAAWGVAAVGLTLIGTALWWARRGQR